MAEATAPFIRIRGLTRSFGENPVLRGVDLDVFHGETLAVLGGSGSGKSVLLKHLPGLLRPEAGTITVDGVEISHLKERELGPIRRRMGVLFQGGALFDSMNVAENLAFPLRESGMRDESEIAARVAEALEIVQLPGRQDMLPPDLSGGMRKRVALARAIVHRPECVLFDEPHTGLDPVNAAAIDRLILNLRNNLGTTHVIVTHELRSVFRIATRVAFLADGLIHWTGSPDELRDSEDPVLRAFLGDGGYLK